MTSDDDATVTGLHAQATLAPGDVLGGRFRIEGVLGVGGMGVVHRAHDLSLDVPVALKVLRPELASRPESFARFRQELLLARQVSHPAVVRIHDIAHLDGRWVIGMDCVDGESLAQRLERDGRLDVTTALAIARRIAGGLSAAHARGIVHRDLKPSNILLDAAGDAYIVDFGVARSLSSGGGTRAGVVVGTPDYLSPEQARGEPAGPRSDLYALGLILYEMLAGAPPFAGGTVAESIAQRIVRAPPSLARVRDDLPAWVVRLVDRLLRPRASHRFADADAVVAAIDARRVPGAPGRTARLIGGLAIAAVAAVALAWGWHAWRDADVPAVPASAALARLVVQAVPADDDADRARDDALASLLRASLVDAGVAVVDDARTAQARRQAGGRFGDARAATLLEVAAADRLLDWRWERAGDGWRLRGRLQTAGGPVQPIDGAPAATREAAWSAWIAAVSTALVTPPATLVPDPWPPQEALAAYGRGLAARAEGQPVRAVAAFKVATAAAPRFLEAWQAQAAAELAIGDEDAAATTLEQAQRNATVAAEPLRRRLAADRALLQGDAAAARDYWRARVDAQRDDTAALFALARADVAAGNPADAATALRTLVARDAGDPRAWFELGKLSILQGDARRAVDEELVRALLLFRRGGDAFGIAETINALGVGYGRLGQTRDAEEQYRKAVELREAVGNRRGVAVSLSNLAAVQVQRGEFDAASASLARARELHRSLGNRAGIATAEGDLGMLAEERGDYPAALAAYRRALGDWEQAHDAHGVAETLNDIGFAHYQLGAYDSAQAFFGQAASAYGALDDRTGEVRTMQNLGLLDMARGRWASSKSRLQRSLSLADGLQMVEEAAVSRRNLAELALLQGDLDTARDEAARAGEAFAGREDQRGTLDAALLRARVDLARGDDAALRATLAALPAPLAQASLEQQAIEATLQGILADRAGETRRARAAWERAARFADGSGIRAMQLSVALQRDPGAAALDAPTAQLGHAWLRLRWLEGAMARLVRDGDAAAATRLYGEARRWLQAGAFGHAAQLHTLGAAAARATGDAAGEEAALQAAREAAPAAPSPADTATRDTTAARADTAAAAKETRVD